LSRQDINAVEVNHNLIQLARTSTINSPICNWI